MFPLAAALLLGCDQIFPSPADLGPADLPGDAQPAEVLRGQVCVLAELRDYRACSLTHPHGPVDIQLADGAARTQAGSDGRFELALPPGPEVVVLRAEDPRRQLQAALVPVPRRGGATAVPMVLVERLELLRALGLPLDPARGAVLAYVVDGAGQPLRGVQVQVLGADARHQGPFFEDGLEALRRGRQTGPGGLIAVFELAPGTVTLQLTGPRQDRYTLPVAAGALTFSLLR